jgi:hypothetical protein
MLIAIIVLLLLVIALQLLALQNTAWVLYLVKMKAPEKPVPEPVVEPEPKTEWVAEEPVAAPVVAGKQESTRRGKKETT